MSSRALSFMGTFSVRKLRADIQNVTMRRNRIVPNLTRFIACYLFVCLAFYVYFRYYLTDEREYGTPRPAALTHENTYRPLKELSTAKELFERLTGKFWSHSKPHVGQTSGSYGSANDILARLEDSLKEQNNLQSPNAVIAGANLNTSLHFTGNSEVKTQDRDERSKSFLMENRLNNKTNGTKTTKLVELTPNGAVPEVSSMARRLEEFRREWLRQRRARVDWQRMLRPCVDNMAWGLAKQDWGKANRSSAITSDVMFLDIRPAGEFSKIFIHSRTADNRTKTIGGDTWRVYLRGTASIAVSVFDHNNGTYEALFLVTEPGVYQLEIYLDYSLCDGFRDPPRDWFIVGNAQGKYQKEGILGPLDDYLYQPLKKRNPITVTIPTPQLNMSLEDKLTGLNACSTTCKHLWDGFGQWVKGEWKPYLKEFYNWTMPSNYRPSGALWIYGDSLAVQHLNSVKRRALCRKLYSQCHRSYNWIYPVKSESLSKKEDDDLDFRPEKVIETIFDVLRDPYMQQSDSTLLLNLGIHFPIGVNFTTYQKLIDDVIHFLKETEADAGGEGRVPKYKAKVIWKTLTAIHKEKSVQPNITNWRFFTTQRVALFNTYAMSAMCKAGFDVIDVFPLTDSYPHGTQDVVHYVPSVFRLMEEMLEKYKVQNESDVGRNTVKHRIKQCIS